MNWVPNLFTPEGGPCMWSCADITYQIVGGTETFKAQARQAVFLAASAMKRGMVERSDGRITIYCSWPFDGITWPGWTRCRLDSSHRYYQTCQSYINPRWYQEGGVKGRALIEHELGHALGMGHHPDPASVMYAGHDRAHDYAWMDREGLEWLGSHC